LVSDEGHHEREVVDDRQQNGLVDVLQPR
jgi:hypothetical protein